jgi:heme exporter protein D
MNISSFFAMGGYAFYVWSAFGMTISTLIINFLLPLFKHRQLLRRSKSTISKNVVQSEFSQLQEVS